MKSTVYIRRLRTKKDEPCSGATVALRKIGSTRTTAYLGASWGEHKPSTVLAHTVINPSDVWAWVAAQGFERSQLDMNIDGTAGISATPSDSGAAAV